MCAPEVNPQWKSEKAGSGSARWVLLRMLRPRHSRYLTTQDVSLKLGFVACSNATSHESIVSVAGYPSSFELGYVLPRPSRVKAPLSFVGVIVGSPAACSLTISPQDLIGSLWKTSVSGTFNFGISIHWSGYWRPWHGVLSLVLLFSPSLAPFIIFLSRKMIGVLCSPFDLGAARWPRRKVATKGSGDSRVSWAEGGWSRDIHGSGYRSPQRAGFSFAAAHLNMALFKGCG